MSASLPSSSTTGDLIEEGSLVLAHVDRLNVIPIEVDSTKTLHCRHGTFKHRDMISLPYGSRLQNQKKTAFLNLLRPAPFTYSNALSQKTQIVRNPDISMIMTFLDIQPSLTMIESGTGSGSASLHFSRALGKKGRLLTYEGHFDRVQSAQDWFCKTKIAKSVGGNIEIFHRNVYNDGFDTDGGILKADRVFLDLPSPWLAIPHLTKHLNDYSKICCYVPCIEQAQETLRILKTYDWKDLQMIEVQQNSLIQKSHVIEKLDQIIDQINQTKRNQADFSKFVKDKKTGIVHHDADYIPNANSNNITAETEPSFDASDQNSENGENRSNLEDGKDFNDIIDREKEQDPDHDYRKKPNQILSLQEPYVVHMHTAFLIFGIHVCISKE